MSKSDSDSSHEKKKTERNNRDRGRDNNRRRNGRSCSKSHDSRGVNGCWQGILANIVASSNVNRSTKQKRRIVIGMQS